MVGLIACTNPVDNLEIGEPFDQSEAILDQWVLVRVHHIDELDLNKPFTDLTSLFTATASEIEFTSSSFTYTHGSGPDFLESDGTWQFDDENYPEYLSLNQTTQLQIGQPIRTYNDTLVLKLERKCEEKTVSSYEYLFTRK